MAFAVGGFEVPLPGRGADARATVIRALNVLRQYDEAEVLRLAGSTGLLVRVDDPGRGQAVLARAGFDVSAVDADTGTTRAP